MSAARDNPLAPHPLTSVAVALSSDPPGDGATAGSARSFRQVFEEELGFVRRALRLQGISRADLDDVCQEVFIVVHRKLDGFEGRSSLRSWLWGIAWRVSQDWKQRAHRRHEELAADLPEIADAKAGGRGVERLEAIDRLLAVLAGVDEDKRAVFFLYEVERLPMKEVVELVGCPLFTGYSRLRAARAQARQSWERLVGAEGKP